MATVAQQIIEGRRQAEQTRLDTLKTAAERNKWGQFATPLDACAQPCALRAQR